MKDVIALFYVWKRHGSCAKYTDFDDDDDLPEPDMPAETKYMAQQLKSTSRHSMGWLCESMSY